MEPSFGFIFFGLIGLTIIYFALYYLIKAKDSNNWATTNGKILSSEEIATAFSDGQTTSAGMRFKSEIYYSYNVISENYISKKIVIFFDYYSSEEKSIKLIEKYPKDSKVTVFYDPDKPEDSVLEPGISDDMVVFLIIGIIFLILGLFCGFIYFK